MTGTRHIAIAIHGGAGTIRKANLTETQEAAYREMLELSLRTGYEILDSGGEAIDAVQSAVNVMEDSPLFNAGKGAVFTHHGVNEQDACIMDGVSLEVGAVAGVKRIANPIDLARQVLERSPHVLLSGRGAERFASQCGIELVDSEYFFTDHRWEQLVKALAKEEQADGTLFDKANLDHSSDDSKVGTVGAVALDRNGNLAAATSTGGMTNKRFGRIGDSPVIGAGTYANNETCAISVTGHGEYVMRAVTAYDIHALMTYQKKSLEEAARIAVFERLDKLGGLAGLIAVDRHGNVTMPFNTEGMYRGYLLPEGELHIAIYKDDD